MLPISVREGAKVKMCIRDSPDAYDTLKALTRGKSISKEDILKFAESLDILSDEDRATLVNMTPASYIGKASELADILSLIHI